MTNLSLGVGALPLPLLLAAVFGVGRTAAPPTLGLLCSVSLLEGGGGGSDGMPTSQHDDPIGPSLSRPAATPCNPARKHGPLGPLARRDC